MLEHSFNTFTSFTVCGAKNHPLYRHEQNPLTTSLSGREMVKTTAFMVETAVACDQQIAACRLDK